MPICTQKLKAAWEVGQCMLLAVSASRVIEGLCTFFTLGRLQVLRGVGCFIGTAEETALFVSLQVCFGLLLAPVWASRVSSLLSVIPQMVIYFLTVAMLIMFLVSAIGQFGSLNQRLLAHFIWGWVRLVYPPGFYLVLQSRSQFHTYFKNAIFLLLSPY